MGPGVLFMDAMLDGLVAAWPAGSFRLYTADPAEFEDPSEVELADDGGYAPIESAAGGALFDAAAAGEKSAVLNFGTSTDSYSDTATAWGFVDEAGVLVWSDLLPFEVAVDEAGTGVSVTVSLFFRVD